MSQLPGEPTVEATTVNRISAMTLIIPIKQELTAPLSFGPPPGYDYTAPPVRPVENLYTVLKAVQYLVSQGTPNALNQVATIHYARWVIINNGADLLFCSNYDTSLDQYLSDFITIANQHPTPSDPDHVPWMDLLWGNCVGYPYGDVTAFIEWARSWQVETTLLFPTISDLTVRDVAWLRKFKHLHDEFDRFAQEVSPELWPRPLRDKYEAFMSAVNEIDVTVVGS